MRKSFKNFTKKFLLWIINQTNLFWLIWKCFLSQKCVKPLQSCRSASCCSFQTGSSTGSTLSPASSFYPTSGKNRNKSVHNPSTHWRSKANATIVWTFWPFMEKSEKTLRWVQVRLDRRVKGVWVFSTNVFHFLFEADVDFIALGQRFLKLIKLLPVELQL